MKQRNVWIIGVLIIVLLMASSSCTSEKRDGNTAPITNTTENKSNDVLVEDKSDDVLVENKSDDVLVENDTGMMPFEPSKLRGFNLQSKILVGEWVNNDADEWAFEFMVENGFNFARIPMEVDQLYIDDQYTQWNNEALVEMDRIISLGQKYGIHILLDLHTLPGIRPSQLPSSDSMFNDDERLSIWKDIFNVIATRYKDIQSTELSYNLINEPYAIADSDYMDWIGEVREVIRSVDTKKVLFIDPNNWEGGAMYDLLGFQDPYIVATPHFYQPFLVTHYLAEWVEGADLFPIPEYPSVDFNGFLYGTAHEELKQPITFYGDFSKGTIVRIQINEISNYVDFNVSTPKESLYRQTFQTDGDTSRWKEVRFNDEWKIYQNVYDKEVIMTLSQDATELNLALVEGDWLTISSITIEDPRWDNPFSIEARSFDWGTPNGSMTILSDGILDFSKSSRVINKAYLYEHYFHEWTVFNKTTKIPIVACEFGVYNKIRHEISLKVIEDNLALFKENGFGFALWNLSGSFGIFDSGRDDVVYENYNGRKLDREMLELLLAY